LLVITGSMGAGKSAVLGEASDLLAHRGIVHAAIDLDALGLAHLPSGDGADAAMYANLRSVCANYAALGVRKVLLARALESRAELDLCRDAVAAENTIVCRLTAGVPAMQQRVRARESGIEQQRYVDRVELLNGILDAARLEDFALENENCSLTGLAMEMLGTARWIVA
jgi:hypothetical protein